MDIEEIRARVGEIGELRANVPPLPDEGVGPTYNNALDHLAHATALISLIGCLARLYRDFIAEVAAGDWDDWDEVELMSRALEILKAKDDCNNSCK